MFENNPDEAFIPQKKYQEICNTIIKKEEKKNEGIKQDFLIGNYFKLVKHCEGLEAKELSFVHRSILRLNRKMVKKIWQKQRTSSKPHHSDGNVHGWRWYRSFDHSDFGV